MYGTEFFEPEHAASRDDVQAVIGAEAERIAWLWCTIERDTLDPRRGMARLRQTQSAEVLTDDEVTDLAMLWAADAVEQIGRMAIHERALAGGLLTVVAHACEAAQQAVSQIRRLLP